MKKFLCIWFALNLAFGPVAGAFASPMPYMAGPETEEHCMGHEPESSQPQDTQMDCCDSEFDQKECCDHCVSHVSGLLDTSLSLSRNGPAEPTIAFIRPVLSTTHSPPYKPPQT